MILELNWSLKRASQSLYPMLTNLESLVESENATRRSECMMWCIARSAEIWQYVFTINHAASTYSWANVAEYDFAFRQMMGKNPLRSW